jgi:N-acetylneuraminic acid mutarotase
MKFRGKDNTEWIFATAILCLLFGTGASNLVADDRWTKKADMPTPRWSLAASAVDDKIYAIGGWLRIPLATVEVYHPATDTWQKRANMPTARVRLSTSAVDGKIYAFGGITNGGITLSAVEAFDPATNSWEQRAEMPTPMGAMSTSAVNGKIYVIGGYDKLKRVAYSTVFAYDPITDTWTKKAKMPTPRGSLATVVFKAKIYAFGGFDPGKFNPLNLAAKGKVLDTVEIYDPETNRWSTGRKMPEAKGVFGIGVVNEKIYIIGGSNPFNDDTISKVDIYDPNKDTWTVGTATRMPTARSNVWAGEVDGKLYVFGGYSPDIGVLSTVEEYTPDGWPFPLAVSSGRKLPTLWGTLKRTNRRVNE